MTLDELNRASVEDAQRAFLKCCGSTRWAKRMVQQRPFDSFEALLGAADFADALLEDEDWLEAFAAHPRIGERSSSAWSQNEQAAALNSEEAVKQRLSALNGEYEKKFGFIFIVFASGKQPAEIVKLMEARMNNDRATEIRNAAEEQKKISRARLHKLLES